jgi:hypothetical protein
MRPVKNIVELRQQLAERFPQLRSGSAQFRNALAGSELPSAKTNPAPDLQAFLAGQLTKGRITELIPQNPSCGSAFVLSTLIRRLATDHWVALIDGSDSFDAAGVESGSLPRFLWVRCQNADQALKSADLLLRDGNIPVVLLDLALNPDRQLRKIPSSTWYRLQRIIHNHSTALLAVVPWHLIPCADNKCFLRRSFGLSAIAQSESELLEKIHVDFEVRHHHGSEEGMLAQAG